MSFVAVADFNSFRLHASKPNIEEVNFCRSSPTATFSAIQPGELLLFKHSPRNYIAGGGFFTRFLHLPISLAWDAFGEETARYRWPRCENASANTGEYRWAWPRTRPLDASSWLNHSSGRRGIRSPRPRISASYRPGQDLRHRFRNGAGGLGCDRRQACAGYGAGRPRARNGCRG